MKTKKMETLTESRKRRAEKEITGPLGNIYRYSGDAVHIRLQNTIQHPFKGTVPQDT